MAIGNDYNINIIVKANGNGGAKSSDKMVDEPQGNDDLDIGDVETAEEGNANISVGDASSVAGAIIVGVKMTWSALNTAYKITSAFIGDTIGFGMSLQNINNVVGVFTNPIGATINYAMNLANKQEHDRVAENNMTLLGDTILNNSERTI